MGGAVSSAWLLAGITTGLPTWSAWPVEASPKTLPDGQGVDFNFQVRIVVSTPSGHTSCTTS